MIDKPAGMTSHDVVGRCRRVFGQRRVGHAGTLDPDATGVLLVGLGQATRLLQFLSGLSKAYECLVVLGVATSTLDASGEVTGSWDMRHTSLLQARQAAADLTGDIEQIPPMVSALKVGGRRLHELARAGIEVERAPRKVHVSRFDLEGPLADLPASEDLGSSSGASGPVFAARLECSSGTYVRTLAADLGVALGGGAHLRDLRRTSIGRFDVAEAVALDDLGPQAVLPPSAAVSALAGVTVGRETAVAISYGKVLEHSTLGVGGTGPWAVHSLDGDLLAVYADHGSGRAKPVVVLAAAGATSP